MLRTAGQWIPETGNRSKSALGGNLAVQSTLLARKPPCSAGALVLPHETYCTTVQDLQWSKRELYEVTLLFEAIKNRHGMKGLFISKG